MEEILNFSGTFSIYALGFILIIIGYIGSIMPSLPGPPIALLSIYLIHFTDSKFSLLTLISLTLLALIMGVADYFVPILGTKKFGGSTYGVKGSTIGLVIGVLITIFTAGGGFLLLLSGPFLGAFLGEKYAGNNNSIAIKSATGSLLGFLAGTFGKIIVVTIILVAYVLHLFV